MSLLNCCRHDATRKVIQWSAIATLLSSLTGCGNGLADVSGNVTLDGQPLQGGSGVRGTVFFQPINGGTVAVGMIDGSGRYQLSTGSEEGAAPGDYFVTCTASQIVPSKEPGGTPGGRRITDPKYSSGKTSGFQFTVQSGSNEFDIPLQSRPDRASR